MPVYRVRVINKAIYHMLIRADSEESAKEVAQGMEDKICSEEYLYDIEVDFHVLDDITEADND